MKLYQIWALATLVWLIAAIEASADGYMVLWALFTLMCWACAYQFGRLWSDD